MRCKLQRYSNCKFCSSCFCAYQFSTQCLPIKLHLLLCTYIDTNAINNLRFVVHFAASYILIHSINPQSIAISEGESASYSCSVSGHGIKYVEWYKDKVKIPNRYITYNHTGGYNISIIQLTAVSVAQGGTYECRTSIVPRYWKPGGYKAQSAMLYVTGKVQRVLLVVCHG